MEKFLVQNTQKRQREESDSESEVEINRANITDISKYPGDGPTQPILKCYPSKQQGHKSRSFVSTWYTEHCWIEYSIILNAIFCFACRHFNHGKDDETAFTTTGFSNWKKAYTSLPGHRQSAMHSRCMEAWDEFKEKIKHGSKIIKSFFL